MYDNRISSQLYKYPYPPQDLTIPGKTPVSVGSTSPQEPDNFGMLSRDEWVAMVTTTGEEIPVSPHTRTITPPRPASPTVSDSDSELLEDGSNSPCSFTGEECPDLCGGPKHSCRSWTPPASPFYYTDDNGIFLLDDRQNYEDRQKIELEHTLRDLDERLQRLRHTMSPPRFLSRLPESQNSTPSPPPGGKPYGPSEKFPRSPTEDSAEHSHFSAITSRPCPSDCLLHCCELSPTPISTNLSQHTMNTHATDEVGTASLGELIHASLQRVESTNSPPKYLANISKTESRPLLRAPTAIRNSYEELREGALSTKLPSRLHRGNTAYPTPLPSSPELKPSRKKRARDESSQDDSGRKRRCGEDGVWIPTQ